MLDVEVILGVVEVVWMFGVDVSLKAANRFPECVCDHGVIMGRKGMLTVLLCVSVVGFVVVLCCLRVLCLGVVFVRRELEEGCARDVESVQGVIGLLVLTGGGVGGDGGVFMSVVGEGVLGL